MFEQITLSIDLNKCVDCTTCQSVCEEYHGLNGVYFSMGNSYQAESSENAHWPFSCNHCMNPLCILVCPENNYRKRQDGIVIHDSSNCRACMRCVDACPFHGPRINVRTNRAEKCNLCVERIDQGLLPICVVHCPTGAISIVKKQRKVRKSQEQSKMSKLIENYMNPSIHFVDKKGTNEFS